MNSNTPAADHNDSAINRSTMLDRMHELIRFNECVARILHDDPEIKIKYLGYIPARKVKIVPDSIVVEDVTGSHDARFKLVEGLTDIYRTENQDPKATLRVPGLVGVSSDTFQALKCLVTMRAEFKRDMLKTFTSVKKRQDIYQDLNGLAPLQLVRGIELIDDLKSMTFRWCEGDGVKKLTMKELRNDWLTEVRKLTGNSAISWEDFPDEIDDDSAYVRRLSYRDTISIPDDENVAIKRDTKPHIRVRISESGRTYYRQGPVPIIYCLDQALEPSIRSTAGDYDRTEHAAAKEESMFEDAPMLTGTNYFRYKIQHRSKGTNK